MNNSTLNALIYLTVIFVIVFIIYCIINQISTYKYQHTPLSEITISYEKMKPEIYNSAILICTERFNSEGKRIYKKNTNGATTKQFLTSFEKAVNKEFANINKTITQNTSYPVFTNDFLEYVHEFHKFAEVMDFKSIIQEFIYFPHVKELDTSEIILSNSLFSKFIKINSPSNFQQILKNSYNLNEFTGIYIIYNKNKNKYYVGQGKKTIQRCIRHFLPNDNAPAIKKDFDNGNEFYVNFIKFNGTDFETLDELEYEYIGICNAVEPHGYNHVRGNRTNR